jgi:flagellar hook-associated protein 1 FlgK
MASLISVFDVGKSALLAHQVSTHTAANNIANVNTEGYSRRVASLRSLSGVQSQWGEIGRGVTAQSILRQRAVFLDAHVRDARSQLGDWNLRDAELQGVDAIFAEAEGTGLGARLDDFFNAWQDLANGPQNSATRSSLRQKSLALMDVLHNLSGNLRDKRQAAREQIEATVEEINSMLGRIAELNDKIRSIGTTSQPASSLLDERDVVIDRLSALVDVDVLHRPDGTLSLYINSQNVVDSTVHEELATLTTQDGENFFVEMTVAGGEPSIVTGGKLGGLLEINNVALPGYSARLDQLASSLVEEVNALHRAGYNHNGTSGLDFFDPTKLNAATISLSTAVESDLNNIAAGATDSLGDNAQALAIAGLKNANISSLGTTLNDFYTSLISAIGADAGHARDTAAHLQIVQEQLTAQRESVQGVSLDEEMTNLIRFQHAYDAAAKLIQTADEMMESVLNMV